VQAVFISPDTRWILAASKDLAWLSEAGKDGRFSKGIALPVGTAQIRHAVFTTDGSRLVTISDTIRVWSLRLDNLMRLACRTAGRNLTKDEWEQYLPARRASRSARTSGAAGAEFP